MKEQRLMLSQCFVLSKLVLWEIQTFSDLWKVFNVKYKWRDLTYFPSVHDEA